MWLLHFLPDSFLHTIINIVLFAGLGLTGIGFFLIGFIPGARNYKTLVQILGVVLLVAGIYWKGGYGVEMEWRARVAEVEKKVAIAEAKAKEANTKVQEKIVTKIVKIKEKAEVTKENIRRNKEKINAECKLSDEAVAAYNSSIIKEKK
jgi:hypothetical protein